MIAYDSSAQGLIPADSTATFNHTCTGANLYLFVLTEQQSYGVTYNGVAMTRLYSNTLSASFPYSSVWGLANPDTGTHAVSVSTQSTYTTLNDVAMSVSYTGVDPIQPEAYNSLITVDTSPFLAVNTVTDNAWVVMFIRGSDNVGRDYSAGASTTLRQGVSCGINSRASAILDSNAAVTPVGTKTLTAVWSFGYGNSSILTFSVKPYLTFGFTGPSSGNVNSASTNFTITPDVAVNGTVTITPTGVGSAGLSPTVLNFSNSAVAQTFTITPLNSGAIILTVTNGCGINNPTALTYTANAVIPSTTVIGTAIPGNTLGMAYFSAPSTDGGASIVYYTATSTPGSFSATSLYSPITVTGLTNGTSYYFKVKATNSVGDGAESSASNSIIPFAASTTFTFTGPSAGNVQSTSTNFTVTPNNDGYYGTITITPSGNGSTGLTPTVLTFSGTNTPQTFTITPLNSGAITLTPTNNGGLSNPANLTYTASAVVPLAPTIGYATPDINSIRVSVVAPTNDGGSAITNYTSTCSNGDIRTSTTAGEIIFTNLIPGTLYTFYASATNAIGTSSNSATTVAQTPLTVEARYYNNGPKFNITNGVGNILQS